MADDDAINAAKCLLLSPDWRKLDTPDLDDLDAPKGSASLDVPSLFSGQVWHAARDIVDDQARKLAIDSNQILHAIGPPITESSPATLQFERLVIEHPRGFELLQSIQQNLQKEKGLYCAPTASLTLPKGIVANSTPAKSAADLPNVKSTGIRLG